MPKIRADHIRHPSEINLNMPHVHSHAYYEIYYLIKGDRNYFIEDKVYRLTSGDFALIAPSVFHRTAGPITENVYIYFEKNALPPYLGGIMEKCFDVKVIRIPPGDRNHIEALLTSMCREYSGNSPCRDIMLDLLLSTLITMLYRYSLKNPPPTYDDDATTAMIMTAVTYINEHYSEDITAKSLAAMSYMSLSHFCRQFKRVIGVSPTEYINGTRIKTAARLLEQSALSITEISSRVGFSSSNYFGDLFRRYKGMSPRAWRHSSYKPDYSI